MKKTRHLVLMLILTIAMTSWAQQTTPRLVVWQKSGEKVYFQLADMPETTFENGLLVIKTKNTEVQYQLENILRYTYEGITSSIDLMPNDRSISVSRDGDDVTISNLHESTAVQVFAANGVLLETHTAKNGQPITISMEQRPAGMYIIKAGKDTIKLMRQ